jgi:hypothetical protein
MTPRPVYRWKSFWLGVWVLGFLGWAWERSNVRREYIEWVTATGGTIAGQYEGCMWFYRGGVPAFYSEGLRAGGDEASFEGRCFEGRWFPRAAQCEAGEGYLSISIAHWFLILLFLVPWLAFLFWRVRKRGKPNP